MNMQLPLTDSYIIYKISWGIHGTCRECSVAEDFHNITFVKPYVLCLKILWTLCVTMVAINTPVVEELAHLTSDLSWSIYCRFRGTFLMPSRVVHILWLIYVARCFVAITFTGKPGQLVCRRRSVVWTRNRDNFTWWPSWKIVVLLATSCAPILYFSTYHIRIRTVQTLINGCTGHMVYNYIYS